jgi:mannosyl-3-phosphoglycerate synthase
MRITYPYQAERLGAVRIYALQQVFELDSEPASPEGDTSWGTTVSHVPSEAILDVQRRMAIVVPCRDERLKVLEGVLTGIPHSCLLIFVSNSSQDPVDRFVMERDTLERFCRFAQRSAVAVHQKDPGLARAFIKAGLPEMVSPEGVIRDGKGEGMAVGTMLAALAHKDYVGFIDADNYVPGSITEYVKAYAADFHLAQSPYAMVRISWRSKPKVVEGSLFFNRWGRTSSMTNRFFNQLIGDHTGFGTEALSTGNAGEHAITLNLALKLRFASGYAVEPYELLYLFEQYGGIDTEAKGPVDDPEVMHEGIQVFQVETCNPHFHEDKGPDHVEDMRRTSLALLCQSSVCPPRLRDEIVGFLSGGTGRQAPPEPAPVYPPLANVDSDVFLAVLAEEAGTFEQIVHPHRGRVSERLPIPFS